MCHKLRPADIIELRPSASYYTPRIARSGEISGSPRETRETALRSSDRRIKLGTQVRTAPKRSSRLTRRFALRRFLNGA